MSQDWTVRIKPAQREPFVFVASFEGSGSPRGVLADQYLYGDGDLAVFLEDLGAEVPAITVLLQRLNSHDHAAIAVDISEEAMEVLVKGRLA